MFANTLSITIGGVAKVLNRVNQDGYGSEYYLNDGTSRYTMKFSHTIPPKIGGGESHLVRLDRAMYDGSGILLRTASAWAVIKTFDGQQDDTAVEEVTNGLVGFLTAANVTKVVDREN